MQQTSFHDPAGLAVASPGAALRVSEPIENAIDQFRLRFDATYLGGLPLLLNSSGASLAFESLLPAIDRLAGIWSPGAAHADRFRGFMQRYFPDGLGKHAAELWHLRNQLANGLAPGSCELLVHQSALHLTRRNERLVLNAEDCFAELALAANRYFSELLSSAGLRENFRRRLATDSGVVAQWQVVAPQA